MSEFIAKLKSEVEQFSTKINSEELHYEGEIKIWDNYFGKVFKMIENSKSDIDFLTEMCDYLKKLYKEPSTRRVEYIVISKMREFLKSTLKEIINASENVELINLWKEKESKLEKKWWK